MVDKNDKPTVVENTQDTADVSAAAVATELPASRETKTVEDTQAVDLPDSAAARVSTTEAAIEPDSTEAALEPDSKPAAARPARRGGALAGLSLLLSLVALGVSAWLYYLSTMVVVAPEPDSAIDVRAELDAHARQLSQVASREQQSLLDSNTALQRDLQAQLLELREIHEDRYSQLQAAQNSQRQRLLAYTTTDRSDWMLAEAEYLLRLANQRVIMAGDTASAMALLTAADGILLELEDSELYPVRSALAADLAALRALPPIDVEGTWLRLQALIGQVDALVLFQLPQVVTAPAPIATENWRQRLALGIQTALEKISSYVVITSRATPYKPMLSPQWEGMVRQNLRMLLEQARAALLSGNQTLYQHSLQNTRRWLNEFFSLEESGVSALDAELDALSGLSISQEYPDINTSLAALKSLINTRHMVAEGQ